MIFYKYPFEQYAISLDFSADLGAGNSIAGISSIAAVNDITRLDSTSQIVAASPAPAISGTGVTLTVMGGQPGERHTLSVRVVSSIGEDYEGKATLRILRRGYTTVDDVAGLFPTFKRGTPQQNPPDELIQTFIGDCASEIDSVLLRRFNESISQPPYSGNLVAWLAALPLPIEAANILEKINRFGAAVQLAGVLASYGVSGVAKLATQIEATYVEHFGYLNARGKDGKPMPAGPYDHLFDSQARTESPRPLFGGIGGAETDHSTPEDRGEDRAFGRNQEF
jgi:hypothetical protein